jgi:hypothetical protein
MEIVGYGKNRAGERYWIMKNSWGPFRGYQACIRSA